MQPRFQPLVDALFPARFLRGRELFALAILLLAMVPLHAISVIPPTFPELVQLATQIVRVQILEVSSRYDAGPNGARPINTYVKCRVLRTMKGAQQETLTLRLLGGQVGDIALKVSGQPTFVAGEKYILFVAQNGTAFCPLVAVMHGSYPVVNDDTTAGTERVLRNNREPLVEVAGVSRPMSERALPDGARAALVSALSVTDFENAITSELAHAQQP